MRQRGALHQFFAGYFHEDWRTEANSVDDVIRSFVGQQDSHQFARLGDAIAAFVEDHPNDDELDKALFEELGCYYSPRTEGISTRSWLLGLTAKLQAYFQQKLD
jgi:hypothetical protein